MTAWQGTEEGTLQVKIAPFDNGKPRSEDDFIEDPSELMGKPYQVQVGAWGSANLNILEYV